MQQYKVLGATVFKQGTSQGKNGQAVNWTIYSATLENYNGTVTGFDAVNPGDMVTLVTKQNGKYTNINYEKVKDETQAAPAQTQDNPNPQPANSNTRYGGDPRVLKLLVAIAGAVCEIQKQTGATDDLLDNEKIMEILES